MKKKFEISLTENQVESVGLLLHYEIQSHMLNLTSNSFQNNEQSIKETLSLIDYYSKIYEEVHKEVIPVLPSPFESEMTN